MDAIFTTAPPPPAAMMGRACLQVRNALETLSAMLRSHTSSGISTGSPGTAAPTLLWSTSIPPNALQQALTAAFTSLLSVASATKLSASPPAVRMIFLVSVAASSEISTANTRAPSRANNTDAALPLLHPSPRDPAPITNMVLSCSLPVILNYSPSR